MRGATMAAVTLTPDDLSPFATIDLDKAWAMISDALAMAAVVAPCIVAADFAHPEAAKAILRGAVLRWDEAGTGAMQQVTSGPFSTTMDTRQARRGMFWPSEIQQLQRLCITAGSESGAFTVDTVASYGSNHAVTCSLAFGASYCSCGADLTAGLYPLYGA